MKNTKRVLERGQEILDSSYLRTISCNNRLNFSINKKNLVEIMMDKFSCFNPTILKKPKNYF